MNQITLKIDCCESLNLKELNDGDGCYLRLVVQEMKKSESKVEIEIEAGVKLSGFPIEYNKSCSVFELIWDDYVAYNVLNESYTVYDEYGEWQGKLLRYYSKSHFLDYLRNDTFADDDYPGKLQHWCIVCGNHIINVASTREPRIKLL